MSEDTNNNENNMSEEDYLKQYLDDQSGNKAPEPEKQISAPMDGHQYDTGRATDLQYFSFDAKIFPLGKFYPDGTQILVRAAQVKEIQAYSMVEDDNFYDVVEKMNDMISHCVRIKYPNKDVPSSYLDLKDGDRYYAIFLIRELTFQKGSNLVSEVGCKCGVTVKIEMTRNHFDYHEDPEKIEPYFSNATKLYEFTTTNNTQFKVGAPSIGLQKSFTDYILEEAKKKKQPNLSFLKIIPFLLSDRSSITGEGIEKHLKEFQVMEDDDFQFLNSVVNMMKFGIKEVKKDCQECGTEVRTEFTFPNGASGIFVVHDAFDRFIKK